MSPDTPSNPPSAGLKLVSSRPATPCPICKQPAVKPHSPFCSRHCAHIDLGHWMNESYSIPAHEAMDDSDIDAMLEQADKDGGLK